MVSDTVVLTCHASKKEDGKLVWSDSITYNIVK
jgi:hypothetical protein